MIDDDDTAICTWQVYIGSMETPPEHCELDVNPGDEYCPKHQCVAKSLEEL